MLVITELQAWFLIVFSLSSLVLVCWAIFLVIPNRNETIRYLRDRNQTLNYWIEDTTRDPADMAIYRGTDLERRKAALLKIHENLNEQLRKCLIDIEHCNTAIREKNDFNDEQS